MVVGDDKADAAEPRGPERPQEGREVPALGVAYLDTQHLLVAVGADTSGHDDDGNHPTTDPSRCLHRLALVSTGARSV